MVLTILLHCKFSCQTVWDEITGFAFSVCWVYWFVLCIHLGSWAKFNDTWEIGAERDFEDLHYELTIADLKPED